MCNETTSNKDVPHKDITVSIILSESTASLFHLDIPRLDDVKTSSDSNVCSIKPITNLKELLERQSITSSNKSDNNRSLWSLISEEYNRDSSKILEDVAYISRKINDSSSSIDIVDGDLSDELVAKNGEVEDSVLKLDVVKVYMRPLVAVKSEAHQNNLSTEENKILVNVLDNDLVVTESGWINVCRICHGGVSIGNLLAPCRCRGSIGLAHMNCLERWLRESASSRCELCQYHYKIIRQPKYTVPQSILVFLRHPGSHLRELVLDVVALVVYTPSAVASTYMLMLLCDTIARQNIAVNKNVSAHVMAFIAIFGIAAIDFVYSSWLIITFQKHAEAWKTWYRANCDVKIILPPWKRKCISKK